MRVEVRVPLDAPPDAVRRALADPERLSRSLSASQPGALVTRDGDRYDLTVEVVLPAVAGVYRGGLTVEQGARVTGRLAGTRGTVDVDAGGAVEGDGEGDGEGSVVTWTVGLTVDGDLAGVGRSLLTATVRRLLTDLLTGLEAEERPSAPAPRTEVGGTLAAAVEAVPRTAPAASGLGTAPVAGIAAAVGILGVLAGRAWGRRDR